MDIMTHVCICLMAAWLEAQRRLDPIATAYKEDALLRGLA